MTTMTRTNDIVIEKITKEVVKKIRHLTVQVAELAPELPDQGQFDYERVVDLLRSVREDVVLQGASVLPSHLSRILSVAPRLEPRSWWPASLQAKCRSLHAEMHQLLGVGETIAMILREEKKDEVEY